MTAAVVLSCRLLKEGKEGLHLTPTPLIVRKRLVQPQATTPRMLLLLLPTVTAQSLLLLMAPLLLKKEVKQIQWRKTPVCSSSLRTVALIKLVLTSISTCTHMSCIASGINNKVVEGAVVVVVAATLRALETTERNLSAC